MAGLASSVWLGPKSKGQHTCSMLRDLKKCLQHLRSAYFQLKLRNTFFCIYHTDQTEFLELDAILKLTLLRNVMTRVTHAIFHGRKGT